MTTTPVYDRKIFEAGKVLIRPNDEALNAYLIQSGTVRVFRMVDGKKVEIATAGAGDLVGDMAIIRKSNHQSGVEAVDNVVAVVVSPQFLESKINAADPLIKSLLSGLIRRLDKMNDEK